MSIWRRLMAMFRGPATPRPTHDPELEVQRKVHEEVNSKARRVMESFWGDVAAAEATAAGSARQRTRRQSAPHARRHG